METVHLMDRKIDKSKDVAVITLMAGENPTVFGHKAVKIMDFHSKLIGGKLGTFVGFDQGLPVFTLHHLKFSK